MVVPSHIDFCRVVGAFNHVHVLFVVESVGDLLPVDHHVVWSFGEQLDHLDAVEELPRKEIVGLKFCCAHHRFRKSAA